MTERKPPTAWYVAISISGAIALAGFIMIGIVVYTGIGLFGNNSPVMWGFPIVNFVFWIGIGHAGTLISAILFLFRQSWRNSIARFAEAMTLFAVMCAGIFPIIHTGRPWLAAYWLVPYPNTRQMWVNFSSPLLWDVFAVGTYFTVSLLFWYVGLLPDLASMRDRAKHPLRKFFLSFFSLGWNGSAKHWVHYEKAYLILAGIATPLVISVHSVVSFDFAVSLVPGWHTTIFPPYFVVGAIFSGFAMVLTVLVIVRRVLHLERLITMNHLDTMNKVILATSLIVGFAYGTEFFMAWYSAAPYEQFLFTNRVFGVSGWAFWVMFTCNVVAPQAFWLRWARRSIPIMVAVVLLVNVGMWFERFVIIVTSLQRDFLPSSWGDFTPTLFDLGVLVGSFGLFFTLVLAFARLLPVIATSEVKLDLPGAQAAHAAHKIGAGGAVHG
ncbi:polysulfide reductase NrfD [Oligoflexia bacterium]|nr:polysulfide reductase NrfD [Oligoflexia bacterium]